VGSKLCVLPGCEGAGLLVIVHKIYRAIICCNL